MNKYNNYHKHDDKSNIFTPDVNVQEIDYVNRILELGETNNYFTTNHGFGGDIFESRTVCDDNGLHCKFGMEGYIVPNPLEKDNRNYHIVLIPKTNVARKKLNVASSRANTEGYYYKPRLFIEDLLKFDPKELYITTACCAGLLADDDSVNEIFYPLYEHFGKNLMLEVQTHNEDIQKRINTKAISLANELNLPLIGACDSHYIYPEQAKERLELLKGKGINYGSEDNFLLDYPSYDTMCQRFQEQGILTLKQITDCMEQTLIFDECEDIDIDKTIKMPTIYGDLSEDEKIQLLKNKVKQGFNQMIEEEHLNKEQINLYSKELRKEMKVIEECEEADIPMADYFLLNKEIFDTAINEFGGVLTKGGRGSAGGELINRMLGITQIDRLKIDLPIYSERFISTSRVIENRSLADIDINVADQQPFIDAMKKTLGEHQCYPMLAYGTMKESEAFRNVCRSYNLNYNEFNEVGKQLDNYRKDEYWGKYIEEAQKYVGTVISCSVHPCSFVLMNEDITEELGIVKIGEFYCAPITSGEADVWKYLKDDILKVVVWEIIAKVFEEIGKPIMTVNELLNNTTDEVWDIIGDGYTATLNQIDGSWATSMVKQYKPRNIEELAMFTGAIRPNFASFRDNFINRIPQSTGAKELDEVLSQTGGQIIMQECLMKYFEWLDISPAESIGLIKKISKKKIKESDFKKLETTLRKTWIEKVGNDDKFDYTWNALQDQMSYGYCSAHATAVALDCLYCAYLKANYPLEYYTVVLNIYQDDLEKTNRLVEEMKHFGITLGNIAFRHSFDKYGYDKETNTIYKSISSIKNIGKNCCQNLYLIKDKKYNNFLSLLYDIKTNSVCDRSELDILIKLDYFSDFGDINYLLNCVKLYDKFIGKGNFGKTHRKQFNKKTYDDLHPIFQEAVDKFTTEKSKNGNTIYVSEKNIYKMVLYLSHKIKYKPTTLVQHAQYEAEILNYVSTIDKDSDEWIVTNVEINQYGTPYVSLYRLCDGYSNVYKTNKKWYNEYKINVGDSIKPFFEEKRKKVKEDNKWVDTNETYIMLSEWA
jgi:DNA polymerase III alpha subunit